MIRNTKWLLLGIVVVLLSVQCSFWTPTSTDAVALNLCTRWQKELHAGRDSISMHQRGCDDYSSGGKYAPAKGRCMQVAYNLATGGLRGSRLIIGVKARKCVYFEDGTYGNY